MDAYTHLKHHALDEWSYRIDLPNAHVLFIPIKSSNYIHEGPETKKALLKAISILDSTTQKSVKIYRECYNPLSGWSQEGRIEYIVKKNPNPKSKYPYITMWLGVHSFGLTKNGTISSRKLKY